MLSLSPQQMADLVHPEDRDVFFKRFADRLEGQPVESRYQIRGIRPDGAVRWLEVFATAVKYQDEPAVQAVFVDITERKLAEEKLRKSEERFRQITENMLDAISVTDEKGIIQYASPSHQTILGYKTEDLVGKSVFNYLCPEDMDSVMASLEGILEKREARYQYRFRHADGHWVWGEASAKLLLDDAGNASRFVIASRDISESKGMEESLKAGEEKYRRLFESTQTAMEVISLETGLVVLANEATARMFGFAFPADLVGVDSMQYLRPEDVGWVSSKMAQAVGQNWQEIAELQVRTNDGRWIWVSGMTIATEYQGKPALLVSMLDITRLKQTEETLRASEEKFRLLTEKTNDLIFTTDLNFKNTYVSPSVERILGFTPEEFSSRDITQQMTPESLARAQEGVLGATGLGTGAQG